MRLSSNEIMENIYEAFGADLSDIEGCYAGVCYACGAIQYEGVEPDATGHQCEACGEYEVFGIAEAVLMNGDIT